MTANIKTDWRNTKTASECLKHLCLSDTLCDVQFTFKQPGARTLPAHRFVLGMRSAVFEAMFYGPMGNTNKEMLLEDDSPQAFELVLKYMYTDEVSLSGKTVLSCLYTAKKYCIDGLVKKCSEFLQQSIACENACMIYEQAKFYEMKELQDRCFEFILKHPNDIFASKDFLRISRQTLAEILGDDRLGRNEIDSFDAALCWAKNQCSKENVHTSPTKIRKYLADALYKIRFPLMPIDIFARHVTPTKTLTNEKQVMLYQYIATKDSHPVKAVWKISSIKRSGGQVVLKIEPHRQEHPLFVATYGCALQITPRSDIKLCGLTGQFVGVTQSMTLQNVRETIHFLGGFQHHDGWGNEPYRSFMPHSWSILNGSLIFHEPVILQGGRTSLLTLQGYSQLCSCMVNQTGNVEGIEVTITQVPEQLDAIILSK